MTIASFANVRRYRLGAVDAPALSAVLSWLVIPVVFGWLAFALLDSVRNFAPQEIRLSADGEYDPYMDDFVVFYTAGAVAADGESASLYDPVSLRAAQASELGVPPDSIIQLPFFNPPGFVVPLVALSLLPMAAAAGVWIGAQCAVLFAALGALWWKERTTSSVVLSGLLLLGIVSSLPFHEAILHGQMSLLLVGALIALWFGAFERRSDSLVVLALTLLAIKPQLAIVPLAYLLIAGRWRAVALAACVQVLFAAATAVALGPAVYWRWLQLLLEATTWEDKNGIWIHAMFGWNAFVRALLGDGHQLVRTGLTTALSVSTLLYGWTAMRRRIEPRRQPELFALLVFTSVLVSPHLFAQDLVLPIAPIALLALRRTGKERICWLGLGALGWLLTFVHFDLLIGSPDEHRLNLVTLWLVAGVVLAGGRLSNPVPHDAVVTRIVSRARSAHGLGLQFALGATLAVVLLAAVAGLAGQRMAEAITYSYKSDKGPTYRIVIVGLANE